MALGFHKLKFGLHLDPQLSTPSSPEKGDLYVDDATGSLWIYNGTSWVAPGSITIGSVGAPTANGLTYSSGTLALAAADGTNPGALTAGTQTIGGAKTLSSSLTISPNTNQLVLGTTNTTTITMAALSASRTLTLPNADSVTVVPSTASAGQFATGITSGGVITYDTPVLDASGLTGVVAIANGGTNSSTALNNNRIMISVGGAIVEQSALTGNRVITTDADGLPVASSVTDTTLGYLDATSSIQTQLNGKLNLTGGTLSGTLNMGSNGITNLADPVNPSDAANKGYVDSVAQNLDPKAAVLATTDAVLDFSPTYDNGTSGVGATLTATSNGELGVDGINPGVGERVLVKNQLDPIENGIYVVTDAGSVGTPYILTRTLDANTPDKLNGAYTLTLSGVQNERFGFVSQSVVTAIGTDPITFDVFNFVADGIASLNGLTGTTQTFATGTTGTDFGISSVGTTHTFNIPDAGPSARGLITNSSQTIAGAKTLSSALAITPTSNQLVLGTTNTTTISATAPSASRTYTIPDVGGNANFVMSNGAQSIAGVKTFTASPIFNTGTISLNGVNSTNIIATSANARDYTLGDAGANANFVLSEGAMTINGLKSLSNLRLAGGLLNIDDGSAGEYPLVFPTTAPTLGQVPVVTNAGTGEITWTSLVRTNESDVAIANNQSSEANLIDLTATGYTNARAFIIDYAIRRTTSSAEFNEVGTIRVTRTAADVWTIGDQTYAQDNSGVNISVTSGGILQYTSSNVAGTGYAGTITLHYRAVPGLG